MMVLTVNSMSIHDAASDRTELRFALVIRSAAGFVARFMARFPRHHVGALLALTISVGLLSCKKPPSTRQSSTGSAIYVVDVVRLEPRPFEEKLFATGSLVPNEAIQLQSERAGVVKQISFDEGKPAKAGDVLVLMDDSELQAQRERAKAQLELARATEARQRSLLGNRGISPADYEQAEANLHVAQAEVQLIEAQIEKTRIRAPFDGVAGLRRVSIGTYLQPGAVICSFQDISALKIDFTLPERYLGLVQPAQKVMFRIAGGDAPFQATISAIEPSVDVQTRSLSVRAIVPNHDQKLLPGAFAEVQVALDEMKNALLIPAIALVPGLQRQTVFVHINGQVEERVVQAGIRTTDSVQIVSGLSPGEEVVTSGVLQLRPGMKVKTRAIQNPRGPDVEKTGADRFQPTTSLDGVTGSMSAKAAR
jgi:membrane fusion protein (multidrug efflux system)